MAMDDIINAAMQEDWKYVDARIPQVCNNPESVNKAEGLLESQNPNLRDLGASVIEKATIDPNRFFTMMPKLGRQLADSHPYAKYRAAFALAAHYPGRFDTKVRLVLMEAREDKDIGEIAQGYLDKLAKRR